MKVVNCIYFLLLLMLYSCFEEDKRIETIPVNGTIEKSIYTHETFYCLDSSRAVSVIPIDSFDLSFETSDDGWRVFVNAGKQMVAAHSGLYDIQKINSTSPLKPFSFDSPTLHDSTAIGYWPATKGEVIVIGKLDVGSIAKLYKIQFLSVDYEKYIFTYSTINNESTPDTAIVRKNPKKSKVYFSFLHPKANQDIEPAKTSWDLRFTTYLDSLPYKDLKLEYVLRGILQNKGVEVSVDSVRDFNEVSSELFFAYTFNTNKNAIGYDWKAYSFTDGTYTVRTYRTYVIKSILGKYYKIKFVGFFNEKLENGYPKFIIEAIN